MSPLVANLSTNLAVAPAGRPFTASMSTVTLRVFASTAEILVPMLWLLISCLSPWASALAPVVKPGQAFAKSLRG